MIWKNSRKKKKKKKKKNKKILNGIYYSKKSQFTINDDKLPHFKVKHNYFNHFFFPSTLLGWNKLDLNICNSESFTSSKVTFWNSYVLPKIVFFFVISQKELNQWLRLGLRHLQEHNFQPPSIQFLTVVKSCRASKIVSCIYF